MLQIKIFVLPLHHFTEAQVAKLVDALLSGGSARNGVAVRLCSCARKKRLIKPLFFVYFASTENRKGERRLRVNQKGALVHPQTSFQDDCTSAANICSAAFRSSSCVPVCGHWRGRFHVLPCLLQISRSHNPDALQRCSAPCR